MPGTPTPILGLAVPSVGGDSGAWGGELNADLAIIDNLGALGGSASLVGRILAYGVNPMQLAFETGGSGGITDVLPTAVGHFGQGFLIKKVDAGAGAVTIQTIDSQTIDGQASYVLANQFQYVEVISDGSNWNVVANN